MFIHRHEPLPRLSRGPKPTFENDWLYAHDSHLYDKVPGFVHSHLIREARKPKITRWCCPSHTVWKDRATFEA